MEEQRDIAVVNSWEDFLVDEAVDSHISHTAINSTLDTTKPVSAAVAKKIQQKKIDEDFANEAFDFLLPSKLLVDVEEIEKKKSTKGKSAEKPKLSEAQMWELLDVSNFRKSESVALILASKLASTKMKSAAYYRFIDILLQECRTKMEKNDLEALKVKLLSHIRSATLASTATDISKKKPNEKWEVTHYKEEMNIVYGNEEEDEDSELEEEEYDDYEDIPAEDDAF